MCTLQAEKMHTLHVTKVRGSNGDDAGSSGFRGRVTVVLSFPKLVHQASEAEWKLLQIPGTVDRSRGPISGLFLRLSNLSPLSILFIISSGSMSVPNGFSANSGDVMNAVVSSFVSKQSTCASGLLPSGSR